MKGVIRNVAIFLTFVTISSAITEIFEYDVTDIEENTTDSIDTIGVTTTDSDFVTSNLKRNWTNLVTSKKWDKLKKNVEIMDLELERDENGKSFLVCYVQLKARKGYEVYPEFRFVWLLGDKSQRIHRTRRPKDILENHEKSLAPGKYACLFMIEHDLLQRRDIEIKSAYNEDCVVDEDCNSGSMKCVYGTCVCRPGFVHVGSPGRFHNQCLKAAKIGEHCRVDDQCQATYYNSRCFRQSCSYFRRPTPHLPKEIYKAAMVAFICFIMMIVSCLLFYICNRSLLRRNRPNSLLPIDDQFTNEIFNISDELDARRLRMQDKPPTYQDIIARDQLIRGVPPPPYSEAMAAIHGVGRPIACLVVQPSTSGSTLLPSNIATASSTRANSGSNAPNYSVQMAGPSGASSNGVVNANYVPDN